jgi:hypothetical protein
MLRFELLRSCSVCRIETLRQQGLLSMGETNVHTSR